MDYKPLPIGIDNFEKLVTRGYYFIDKTLYVKELLDKKGDVNLFTRPRRFGKTLNMSMLQYFFEDARDDNGRKKDNSYLFDGLKIMEAGGDYISYMGQYPVISLTLKAGKQPDFELAYSLLKRQIAYEYMRHMYIIKDDRLAERKERYLKIMREKADREAYVDSLQFLSQCLELYYGKKAIILIDEYDVPLENAHFCGFYDEMVSFMRSLFESALKTNSSLEFAVITGCLRISKESIFTGLNNLEINSVLSDNFGEYFGFTENEVKELLSDYSQSEKYEEVKNWYNGYIFGSANVYNPWSSIKYVKDHVANINRFPVSYWANTSSNSIIKDLIEQADDIVKTEIENLIAGGTIEKPIHEDITYGEIHESQDNLWNFLFFTGYLKKVSERFDDSKDCIIMTMCIPNIEVRYIYREKILSWFQKKVKEADRTKLFNAVVNFDAGTFETEIGKLLRQSISFNDYYENFYHGFLVGILMGMEGYIVKSNREGGTGRSDIFVKPLDMTNPGIVIEIKVADSMRNIGEKAKEAVEQIIDKGYEEELLDDGFLETRRIGVAFFKKNCKVCC